MGNYDAVLAEKIDLQSGWTSVYSSVQQAIGTNLSRLLTAIGVIIVVGAFFKWLIDRRRSGSFGGAQGSSGLLWALALGATLSAPGLIIPIALSILDGIANAVVGLWSNNTA